MNNFIILLFISAILLGCNSTIVFESDLSKSNIRGKVKSVIESEFTASGDGFNYKKGFEQERKEMIFNEDGNEILQNLSAGLIGFIYTKKNFYDENNKIDHSTFVDEKGNLIFEDFYTYDINGNEVIYYHKNDEGKIFVDEIKIWENDTSISSEIIYNEGYLYSHETTIYNSQGSKLETEKTIFNKVGKIERKTLEKPSQFNPATIDYAEIDTTGNIIADSKYSVSIEYNQYGDYKEIFYVYLNKKQTKTTYLYSYDDKNNWISRVEYLDGEAQKVTERIFEYFK